MRVLIVEDDTDILELLSTYFAFKGDEVVAAPDGMSALKLFRDRIPDLVLLDIVLPRLDGWSVLAAIRAASAVPVILLTSLADTADVVRGLSLGADDYLRKPFEMQELDARITALLRRVAADDGDARPLVVGPICIDDRAKRVTVHGREVTLSPKEYRLLELLAAEPGRVFSSEEIIARLWPRSGRASADDVKQYVHLLRSKLGRNEARARWIRNVKGFGYKLVV